MKNFLNLHEISNLSDDEFNSQAMEIIQSLLLSPSLENNPLISKIINKFIKVNSVKEVYMTSSLVFSTLLSRDTSNTNDTSNAFVYCLQMFTHCLSILKTKLFVLPVIKLLLMFIDEFYLREFDENLLRVFYVVLDDFDKLLSSLKEDELVEFCLFFIVCFCLLEYRESNNCKDSNCFIEKVKNLIFVKFQLVLNYFETNGGYSNNILSFVAQFMINTGNDYEWTTKQLTQMISLLSYNNETLVFNLVEIYINKIKLVKSMEVSETTFNCLINIISYNVKNYKTAVNLFEKLLNLHEIKIQLELISMWFNSSNITFRVYLVHLIKNKVSVINEGELEIVKKVFATVYSRDYFSRNNICGVEEERLLLYHQQCVNLLCFLKSSKIDTFDCNAFIERYLKDLTDYVKFFDDKLDGNEDGWRIKVIYFFYFYFSVWLI